MTFTPTMDQLCGLPREIAECYGKPHIMAHYASGGVKSHKPDEGAVCAVCRQRVGSVHHNPPLSRGRVFVLRSEWGQFVLKPSLIALCGSGTTGCHNGFHGGARYRAYWIWDSDEYAEKWWSGEFLKDMSPHDPALYRFGKWLIHDARNDKDFEYRGGDGPWRSS